MNPTDCYRIDGLNFSYGPVPCLKNLSLDLDCGCFYGLIGPNGCGKSTLLDLMSGHDLSFDGSIKLFGVNIDGYSRRKLAQLLTVVPQTFSLHFAYTVEEVVLMGRHPHIARFTSPQPKDFELVDQALDLMDISHLRRRPVTRLSGGEKQRVMLARSLAQNSEIILLDEVTASLDINHAISIMSTMSNLVKNSGRTIIAALHDLNMAAAYCDRIIVLQDGSLFSFGITSDVLSEQLIKDLYGIPSQLMRDSEGRNHIKFNYRQELH